VDARIRGRGRGEESRRGRRGKGAPARLLARGASVDKSLHVGVDFWPPKELANALDGFERAEVAGQLVGVGLTHDAAPQRKGQENAGNVIVEKATPGGKRNAGKAVEQAEGVRVEGKRRGKERRAALGKGGNNFLERRIRELTGEDHRGIKGKCLGERGKVTVSGRRSRRRRGRRMRRRRRRRRGRGREGRRRGRRTRPGRGGGARGCVARMSWVSDVYGQDRGLGRRNKGRRWRRRRGGRGGARRSAATKEVRNGILGAVDMNNRAMVLKQKSVEAVECFRVHLGQLHDRLVIRVKEKVAAAEMVREKIDAIHTSLQLEEEGRVVALVRVELARGKRDNPHGLAALLLH
jgi:hypothetical protein